MGQGTHPADTYLWFLSTWSDLEHFYSLPHPAPWVVYFRLPPALNLLVLIYTLGWREALSWPMSPARTRTRTARFGVKHTSHWATRLNHWTARKRRALGLLINHRREHKIAECQFFIPSPWSFAFYLELTLPNALRVLKYDLKARACHRSAWTEASPRVASLIYTLVCGKMESKNIRI